MNHFPKPARVLLLVVSMFTWAAKSAHAEAPSPERDKEIRVSAAARALHRSAPVIDGHNDLPWAIRELGVRLERFDLRQPQSELHTDIPRLRTGGVGAQFWSVYVPVSTRQNGQALQSTLEQIELVKAIVAQYPDVFELALSTGEIERIRREGKIASMIGVEGGHSIENSLSVLRQLHQLGARYMTLTHSETLDWADSCTGEPIHGGLAPFGEEVVREMNRLGMLVDLSHVSADCMRDALRVTRAPVIFSHSSARAIADHPRNVPDDVLKLTAENGGVVMVNFFNDFVHPENARRSATRYAFQASLKKRFPDDAERVDAELKKWELANPRTDVCSVHHVLDHIEHIIGVAGIDHVGLGSDFDGIPAVPKQLEDVATYPVITQGLFDRGYSEVAIRKVLGENVMRVFREVERVAETWPD